MVRNVVPAKTNRNDSDDNLISDKHNQIFFNITASRQDIGNSKVVFVSEKV